MNQSELIWQLKFELHNVKAELESYKNGNAMRKLRVSYNGIIIGLRARIRELEREVAKAQNETISSRKAWSDIFDDLDKEHKKELAEKDREIKALKERVLEALRQRDAALDKARDKQAEIYRIGTELEEEKGKNQKLTAQVNKDFENSSIPSSMQGLGRKKIPNSREKTDRKPGGQPGHKGHCIKKLEATESHMLPDPEEFVSNPERYYPTGKTVSRQKIGLKIEVSVVEYTARVFRDRETGSRVHAEFPEGYTSTVNYDSSIKSFAFLLTNECNVSGSKIKRLISELSGEKINISEATINGLCEEFSSKTEPEKKDSLSRIMTSPVINTDFTNANVNGSSKHVLIMASPSQNAAMFIAREHKGHKGIIGTPLESYMGITVHDHATEFYKYGLGHQECMQHNCRYIIGSKENEPELEWGKQMHKLVQEMLHYRNGLGEDEQLDENMVAGFEKRYDEILELGENEYLDNPPTEYYREGYNLCKRLKEYKESELLFLHDKRVPANNSLAERLARIFKRKQKQMMVFRSDNNFEYTCESLGILYTIKFEDANLYERVSDIFSRKRYRKKRKKKDKEKADAS